MNNNTNEVKMKVCTLCHDSFPATTEHFIVDRKGRMGLSSRCKDCLKRLRDPKKEFKREYDEKRRIELGSEWVQKSKDYYWNNKEKKSEYDRKYRTEHKEKRQEQKRRYYLNNREYCLWKSKENALKNAKQYREKRRKYYEKNKEKLIAYGNEWRSKNRTRFNSYSHKRKARKKQLPNYFTLEQWENCLKHFNGECVYCGKVEDITQEHFIPLVKGGEYTVNNIIPACKSCNSSKQDKDFFEWYEEMPFYSKKREQKILNYLGYQENKQQLALFK